MLRTKRNYLSAVGVCGLAMVVKCLTDGMDDDKGQMWQQEELSNDGGI